MSIMSLKTNKTSMNFKSQRDSWKKRRILLKNFKKQKNKIKYKELYKCWQITSLLKKKNNKFNWNNFKQSKTIF